MNQGEVKVAACVVLHNDVSELPGLCRSLAQQSKPVDQTIFCLNGEAEGVRSQILDLIPNAIVFTPGSNLGFAGGVNACLAQTQCDLIFLLNPDVELDRDYVLACLKVFEEEDDVGGVGGLLIRSEDGEECVDSAGFVMQPWLRIVDRGGGSRDVSQFCEREVVIGVCAAAALFSREALEDIAENGDVMDEDFWMYKEDQDLCLRLREAGWKVYFEPSARGRHRRGWAPERRFEVPVEIRRHSLKNRYLLLTKHWRVRPHLWTLPVLALFEIVLFLGLCLRDPKVIIGYARAVALLPKMLAKRKQLMARFSRKKKVRISK